MTSSITDIPALRLRQEQELSAEMRLSRVKQDRSSSERESRDLKISSEKEEYRFQESFVWCWETFHGI